MEVPEFAVNLTAFAFGTDFCRKDRVDQLFEHNVPVS